MDPLHLDMRRTQAIAKSIIDALMVGGQEPLDLAMANTWFLKTHCPYQIDRDQVAEAERAKAISTNKIKNTIMLRRLTLLYNV